MKRKPSARGFLNPTALTRFVSQHALARLAYCRGTLAYTRHSAHFVHMRGIRQSCANTARPVEPRHVDLLATVFCASRLQPETTADSDSTLLWTRCASPFAEFPTHHDAPKLLRRRDPLRLDIMEWCQCLRFHLERNLERLQPPELCCTAPREALNSQAGDSNLPIPYTLTDR